MDYSYLDKEEYRDIPMVLIEENNNGLPFLIVRLNRCATKPHRHKFVQIVYICKGRFKHVFNRKVFNVCRGDIFIIPPYVPHYFIRDEEPVEIIEFEFVPEFIDERFSTDYKDVGFMDFAYLEPFLVTEKEIKPRLNLGGSMQLEIEGILQEIIAEYNTRDSDFQLIIRALLQKLLVLVGREFKKSIAGTESKMLFDRHRDALFAAIDYIDQNLSDPINIEEAARVAMLSQSYFRYVFKQMFKKNFVEYVNDRRIEKATELIRTRPDMRMIDVGLAVGFNNPNHFSRVFRQATGVTPTAFRKSGLAPAE